MSGTGWFWIATAAMALGGLFSSVFQSLRDVPRVSLEELAAQRAGPGAQRRIDRILEDLDGHSTAVGLPRIICNLIVAVSAVFWVAALRASAGPGVIDAVIGIAASSVVIWIFGFLVPHSIAAYASAGTVYAWSPLVRAAYIVQSPLRRVARFFDEVVRRLAGPSVETQAEAVQAELMSVVEEAQQEGQFDQAARNMIEAIMKFRSTTVEQIMTPRTEVEALELTNNLGEVTKFIRASRHSRIPVYEESLDHVVGVFYIKDLMRWLAGPPGGGKPFELRAILRPAYYVPETKTIRELLAELIRKQVHLAMVADEYGGTSGLVTFEDIIEEVFGEIRDEYEIDEPEERVVRFAKGRRAAEIDARSYIHQANAELRAIGVELPEGEEYDTVGGLVVTTLGRIPATGEQLLVNDFLFTVLEAEPTRVSRVRLELPRDPAPPADRGDGPTIVTPRHDGTPIAE